MKSRFPKENNIFLLSFPLSDQWIQWMWYESLKTFVSHHWRQCILNRKMLEACWNGLFPPELLVRWLRWYFYSGEQCLLSPRLLLKPTATQWSQPSPSNTDHIFPQFQQPPLAHTQTEVLTHILHTHFYQTDHHIKSASRLASDSHATTSVFMGASTETQAIWPGVGGLHLCPPPPNWLQHWSWAIGASSGEGTLAIKQMIINEFNGIHNRSEPWRDRSFYCLLF